MSYRTGHDRFGQERALRRLADYPDTYYLAQARDFDLPGMLGQATRLFVEIGPEYKPSVDTRTFADGVVYLGVQYGSHDHEAPQLWGVTVPMAARMVVQNRQRFADPALGRADEGIYFMLANGCELPGFMDGGAEEVLLSNVVGNGMSEVTIARLLCKGRRLLRPDGKLRIRENISPYRLPCLRECLGSTGLKEIGVRGDDVRGYELCAAAQR